MSEQEIIEGNKLIAEFLGAKPCKDWQDYDGFEHEDWYHLQWSNRFQDYLELYSYRYSELKYHFSWDWLMPVVEKIKQMQHDPKEMFMGTTFERKVVFEMVTNLPIYTPINTVFNTVVEFIKFYNKNK